MKKKDLGLIIVIVVAGALVSLLLTSVIFKGKTSQKISVEVVAPISNEFKLPSSTYFNSNSLNPTETITIAPDQNQNPFNGQ